MVQLHESIEQRRPVDQRDRTRTDGPSYEGLTVSEPQHEGQFAPLAPCASFAANPPAGSTDWTSQGDGMDGGGFFYYPPNAAGGVGPDHLMTMAANITLIQDRLGATVSTVDTLVFWSPLAPTEVRGCRLYYDVVSDRWVAGAIGGPRVVGVCSILFAISDSSDPTGSWDFYSISADPGATTFPDGLQLGFNSTWVAFTADVYLSTAAGSSAGTRLYTFDMAAALAGGPTTANTFGAGFWSALGVFGGTTNYRICPARALDTSLSALYILNSRVQGGAPFGNGWQMALITGTGAAPVFTPSSSGANPGLFAPGATSSSFCPPGATYSHFRSVAAQSGEPRFIEPHPIDGTWVISTASSSSNRPRVQNAVVRNGRIWAVVSGGLPGPAANAAVTHEGLNVLEIDPSLPLVDPGTGFGTLVLQNIPISDGPGTHLMFPSLAVNCANDVVVGYSRTDATRFVEAAYSMRLGTDAPGSIGPITTLKPGESTWWQPTFVSADAPWGSYSTTSVDPNDDRTLWTLQPYAGTRVGGADADSRWGTWWGRLGDCEIRVLITDHPDDVDSCIGNPVNFSVTATTGSNPLTYQWRLNGIDILGANSDTYSIGSAIGTDEGVYDCVVCGCGQEISFPAVLEFEEPTITTQPQDFTAALGDVAAFFVVATPSIGNLSYQWFHRGNPVGINDDIHVVGPVAPGDYGDYHCILTDGCGTIQTITVNLLPPVFNNKKSEAPEIEIYVQPPAAIGCVDGSVTFHVIDAPDGSAYEWRKDGVPLVPPQTGSSLILSGLTGADAGVYDVLVDTGSEVLDSNAGVLAVADDPVITNQPDDVTSSSSGTVTFSVTATGQGPLSYQWRFRPNGQGASFSDIVGEIGPTLIRVDVNNSSGGSYRCAVTNQCGTTLSNIARLTIL